MSLATAVAVCVIVGVPLTIIGLYFTARLQRLSIEAAARQAERDRQDEIDRAVTKAVTPIKEDRDYWRDRSEAFETELRNRHGQ